MPKNGEDCMLLHNYDAVAVLEGSDRYPKLTGTVGFKGVSGGTWVEVQVLGLPAFQPASEETPQIGPHGFHIHNGENCGTGLGADPFAEADGHWNPEGAPHGNHPGDFPVLFSSHGRAAMLFFTDRFHPEDVLGKTVVIHESPDDYKSQPAGNSGQRIGCGMIRLSQQGEKKENFNAFS